MTDTELYTRTRIVLAATLLLPIIVGLFNLSTNDANLTKYIKAGTASSLSKPADKKASDKKDEAKKDKDTKTEANTKQKKKATATAGVKPASTYTVKAGDTYGCIAENYYGSFEQWPLVYGANAGGAGYNEYDLAVGAKVQLPALTAAQVKPATNLCE